MQATFLLVQDPTFLSAPLTKEKPPRIRSGLVRIYNVAEITFSINL